MITKKDLEYQIELLVKDNQHNQETIVRQAQEIERLNKEKDDLDDYNRHLHNENKRLNNIIKHTDSWLDRTIEIIKQQPSEDDTWILERLNGIKQCLNEIEMKEGK